MAELNIDKEKIEALLKDTEENVAYASAISDDIVNKYVGYLDELMRNINKDIIMDNKTDDATLQKYFLDLTNTLYFISSQSEFLGLYDDISKSNAKLTYNKAFNDNQINALGVNGKAKPTIAENQIYAENESLNETLVNYIYSRSFKIVKVKVDAAEEMIKTLSKVISARAAEKDYSNKYINQTTFNKEELS